MLAGLCDPVLWRVSTELGALGIFLDIKGAFDNLSIEASNWGMRAKCLPPYVVRWHSHYLCLQSDTVKIKGISTTQSLTQGTPQGVSPGV